MAGAGLASISCPRCVRKDAAGACGPVFSNSEAGERVADSTLALFGSLVVTMSVPLRVVAMVFATVAWAPHAFAQIADPNQSAATPPPAKAAFEFRSHRIGDLLDSSYPRWRGKKLFNKPGCEVESDGVGVVSCEDAESFSKYERYHVRYIGGVPVMLLSYKFFEGKLYSLDMAFHVNLYSTIREMLAGKYGEPTRQRASTIQNRAGASFENITTEWDFREGALKLDMRYGQVDTSWLTFENPAVEKQIEAMRGTINKQKGKGAF
jgi:hypothetical protein